MSRLDVKQAAKSSLNWLKRKAIIYLIAAEALYGLFTIIGGDEKNNNSIADFKVAENIDVFLDDFTKNSFDDETADVHKTVPLQFMLQECGYDLGNCGPDGIYGQSTTNAVFLFQIKNHLSLTGIADSETLRTLADSVLSNENARRRLDSLLIRPYNTPEVRELMDEMPKILSRTGPLDLFLRPDMIIRGGIEAYMNGLLEDASTVAMPGCTNNHLRDAFRHAESIYRLSGFLCHDAAVSIGDFRERTWNSPLPCKLMDIYNHRVAAQMAQEPNDNNLGHTEVLVQGIKEGRLMIYPFPLIRK